MSLCGVRSELIVWTLCLSSMLGFLGARAIDGVRERRLAGSAADIDRNGRWLLPHLQGQPRFLKPPLADWLAAGSMRLFGRDEFSFRLPFAAAGLGIVGLSYVLARRLVDTAVARTTALILSTTFYFVSESHSASTDLLLALFTGSALVSWWFWQTRGRPWSLSWWGFYLSVALACLAKGPVALAIVAIPVLLELTVSGRWQLAGGMRSGAGIGIVLMITLAWPLAVWARIEDAPAQWFWDMHASIVRGEGVSLWGYFGHLAYWSWFSFPWTVLGVAALGLPIFRRSLETWPAVRFCYCWLAGDLAFFCAWGIQPVHYLLPLALPLAILEAVVWHRVFDLIRGRNAACGALLVRLGLLLGFTGFVLATAILMYQQGLAGFVLAAAVGIALWIPIGFAYRRLDSRPEQSFGLLVATGLMCVSIFSGWIKPRVSQQGSCADFARALVELVPATQLVYFAETEDAMPFYVDRDLQRLAATDLPRELASLRHGYLLLARGRYESEGQSISERTQIEVLLDEQNHRDPAQDLLLVQFSPAPRLLPAPAPSQQTVAAVPAVP